MSDEKKTVSFEGQMDLVALQSHLKALLAGIKAGAIYVQSGQDMVGLHPQATVTLELEARRKKDKQSLKLEIKWENEPEPESPTGSLTISDKEPESLLVEEDGD
jgi:amphi-Trp domain-containing protein